jgi:hypothetical protein
MGRWRYPPAVCPAGRGGGHQHRLTVPRHHRVHGAEQDGGDHRNEDSTHVSAYDFAKHAGHSVLDSALDRDKAVHYPISVGCDRR